MYQAKNTPISKGRGLLHNLHNSKFENLNGTVCAHDQSHDIKQSSEKFNYLMDVLNDLLMAHLIEGASVSETN